MQSERSQEKNERQDPKYLWKKIERNIFDKIQNICGKKLKELFLTPRSEIFVEKIETTIFDTKIQNICGKKRKKYF